MIRTLPLLAIAAMLVFLSTQALAQDSIQQARLSIPDMVCMSCEMRVEQAVTAVSGVASIVFDGEANIATVAFDPSQTTLEAILAACEEAGYPATAVDNTEA